GYDDVVERSLLGAAAGQSDHYHVGSSKFGSRRPEIRRRAAKRKVDDYTGKAGCRANGTSVAPLTARPSGCATRASSSAGPWRPFSSSSASAQTGSAAG